MTEIFRATTGTPCYRSPGYWKVKNEERNGYYGIVRYNRQDEVIPFFTQGDANLLANSPEMHDMLWAVLESYESRFSLTKEEFMLKQQITNLLARVDVEEPEGMPKSIVSKVIREAKRIYKQNGGRR